MFQPRKLNLLLGALAATLLLAACSDQDEASQEADALAEDTGRAIEQAPAVTGETENIPAPENVAAAPADAMKTPGGVAYVVLENAAGTESPTLDDVVTVHYTGWTTDGKMFDSSVARGEAATFPLNQLIPGWQEAIPEMTVGDKYRIWIPGELAYDNSTRPGAPKGMLVFDIELLAIAPPADSAAEQPQSGN